MHWLEKLAPDVVSTARRFPFAIVLAAIVTIIGLVQINDLSTVPSDDLMLWIAGFATAAVCAVAGVMITESRPDSRWAGLLLTYALPLAVVAAFQVRDANWIVPLVLPVVALFWLSVSPVTRIQRGDAREDQQNRFWWMNTQAIATAVIAAAGFIIICVGILAIERSLSFLFGISTESLFYRWVLPFVGLFLTPVYWLSTLPRVAGYQVPQIDRPEFVGTAVGFLGQFVLVPLLFIYAAILLAYTAQIVVTQTLPQGTIGWMVLGYVVAGAATWLVLHPEFMRERALVRLYRRLWFWLTLIPLALFALAVWVRVDAYGLTTERVLLIAGGVWAALLAAVFLIGRGDIRLIPALAGGLFLVLGVGPWNLVALPDNDQGARLSQLFAAGAADGTGEAPIWDAEQAAEARSAISYLNREPHGREVLQRVLLENGITYDANERDIVPLMEKLGYPAWDPQLQGVGTAQRDLTMGVDVSATPYYLRQVEAYFSSGMEERLFLRLSDGHLIVRHTNEVLLRLDLADWAARQTDAKLVEPWIDFAVGEQNYRYVVTTATWRDGTGPNADRREVTSLSGELFSDAAEAPTATR